MTSTLATPGAGGLAAEVSTQPDNWLEAADLAHDHREVLPRPGERVAVLGCGSSLYVARAVAALRESLGHGETDAWPAGDPVLDRPYDRVIGISRSGTTTEVLTALDGLRDRVPVTVVTADPRTPIADLGEVISLEHVDEEAVVQSRTATTALAMFRWHLGHDLREAAEQAREVLAIDDEQLAEETLAAVRHAEQIAFVAMGWGFGLAEEASLKLKESTQSWTESYHQTEFRHGPISISAPGRAVWALDELIPDFARDVARTGAALVAHERDPMAELVLVHRLCLLRAADRGLDAGQPRNLERSIILDS
ncbi:SIS domain-containing protein [Nocardioides coralli]|uniref:SIS domain-containing protein n=1 Tax=Nocardioides coralli TaxID=2872154 RepID=UPI001CA3CC89|nr:sugar isomerase [Nocardioides coralli]QZY28588.1 sugar isomerase [Nocardioides coralli]